MVLVILGLVLLQVLRPIPGPASPYDNVSAPGGVQNGPERTLPAASTFLGHAGPLPSAPSVDPLSDSFHPSIAVIIGVLSTMFSLTFLILLYAKHCKRSPPVSVYGGPDPDMGGAPTPALASALFTDRDSGLDRAVVEALPMFSFGALKGLKEGLECAVCLSKFESPEILRLLPKCKHAFHLHCVDVWLNNHSTCPLCRHRVDAHDIAIVVDDLLSALKPPSEPGSFRNSLSELSGNLIDGAFEFYVQREPADSSADLAGCWHGSGSCSWRKDGLIGSERKLGSWRRDNFSGHIGSSERKEGSSRMVRSSVAEMSTAASAQLNMAGEREQLNHLEYYDEQLARRLGHRIIVSDVVFQHRWSDFLPSDVTFFNANMVHLRQQSMSSLPVSSELGKVQGADGDQSFSEKQDLQMGLHEKNSVMGGSARMSNSKVADIEAAHSQLQAAASAEATAKSARKQGSMERKLERQIKSSNMSKGERRWVAGQERCMSEMSGLQRVQQLAAGKQLLAGSEAVAEGVEDETTRRWFATARRTLKWLMGSSNTGVRPNSSAVTANSPSD